MSRLAVVLSQDRSRAVASLLDAALRGIRSHETWRTTKAGDQRAALGWTGWVESRISSADGVTVVLDGRLLDLDRAAGTDAERARQLYQAVGFKEMLPQLLGDFAIVVYDAKEQRLWAARDRLGVKPFYYTTTSDGLFAAASRPRGLLALAGVSSEPNWPFVGRFAGSHYRTFDNAPAESPYRDIAQLPAGHLLRVDANGDVRREAYWTLQEQPDFDQSAEVLAERYRDLLQHAVRGRLAVASTPAFTLSGGMDSSSVLATAAAAAGSPCPAFSTVYSDRTYDESAEIQPMLGTRAHPWHPVRVDNPDVFELVQRMVAAHDEPVATATWLSHFVLSSEVAQRGHHTLFGGLGGDELNAGEYEHFVYHFADLRSEAPADLPREVSSWAAYHDHPIYRKGPEVAEAEINRLTDSREAGRCLPDRRRLTRYARAVNRDFFDVERFEPEMEHPFRSCLKNRSFQDLFRETTPCCLRAEDRQGTAFGIENTLPFLDHRVVEFMFRVPGRLKIREGVTKILLRAAMRGILPEETRTRVKKTGWNAPAHVWFSGRGADALRDLLGSQRFRERGIYDIPHVTGLLDEHQEIVATGAVRENHMMFFWQLVNLELWLQALELPVDLAARSA